MERKPTNQETPKRREGVKGNQNDIKEDVIGGAPAGGIAGSGGVSTNDVGASNTSKNPILQRG